MLMLIVQVKRYFIYLMKNYDPKYKLQKKHAVVTINEP